MENLKEKTSKFHKTTNVIIGDEVIFVEGVFNGSYRNARYEGDRLIHAIVIKDSYGDKRAQHTFTLELIAVEGVNSDKLTVGKNLKRKGRNLYKECYLVKRNSTNVDMDVKEKNQRAKKSKNEKYWEWYFDGQFDKLPESFKQKNKLKF